MYKDDDCRMIEQDFLDTKTTYTYDNIYQLTSAAYPDRSAVSYSYDPAGNRSSMTIGSTTTNYSYDGANKLLTAGTVSYTYDGNGNPTRKTDSSTGQTTTYTYDTENRLTGAVLPNGNSFIYGYDYTGMKVSDTQKGPGGNPDTHQYLWSFGSVINEDGNEGQTADNVVGAVNLSQILTPKTNYIPRALYYSFDGLASVVNTTDSGGNITDSYRYDVYGATLSGGKTKDNHYQFAGKLGVENEASIGLSYMRNRWYDPATGRFITQDPADLFGGVNLYRYVESVGKPSMNLYEYCGNNPINFMDWLGLCGEPTAQPSYNLMGENTTPEEIAAAGAQVEQALGTAVVLGTGIAVMASGAGEMTGALAETGYSLYNAAGALLSSEPSLAMTGLEMAGSSAANAAGGLLTSTSGFVLATNELNNPSETANNINEFSEQLTMSTYFTQTQGLAPLPTTVKSVLPDVLTNALGQLSSQ